MQKLTFELPIYTYQIDFVGHVSNIIYIQWMEIGRLKLMEAVGLPVHRLAQQGTVPVLVHTEIDYKSPLHLGDTVHAELWLSQLKRASAQIEFRFYNRAKILAAAGRQRGLFVERRTMRPRRLQPEESQLFAPYVHAEIP